jgi:hypothetical protein
MINICAQYCNTPLCGIQIKNNKYNGYCVRCYINIYPDKPISVNYRTKERNVFDFIKDTYPDLRLVFNNRIQIS